MANTSARHRARPALAMALLSILPLLVLLTACGDGSDGASVGDGHGADETRPSVAGTWELDVVTVADSPVDRPDRTLEIAIADGEIAGNGGCNQFSGAFDAADDGSLTVGPLELTAMGCDDLAFESTYVGALSTATAWEATPDGLTITSGDTRITYRAGSTEPETAAPLVGTVWSLDTIYGPGEGPQRAVSSIDQAAPGVDLVIDGTTATILNEPCTDTVFEVTFTEENGGGSFDAHDGGGSECRGMESENPNYDVAHGGVATATGYLIDGNRLTLIGDEGELIGFIAR